MEFSGDSAIVQGMETTPNFTITIDQETVRAYVQDEFRTDYLVDGTFFETKNGGTFGIVQCWTADDYGIISTDNFVCEMDALGGASFAEDLIDCVEIFEREGGTIFQEAIDEYLGYIKEIDEHLTRCHTCDRYGKWDHCKEFFYD